MDSIRRSILATGAAAAATAAAPQVFAQQAPQAGAFKFYEKGNVRIRYEEVGSGFPLRNRTRAARAEARVASAIGRPRSSIRWRSSRARLPASIVMDQQQRHRRQIHEGRSRSMTRGALSPTTNWD